jgi:hypothetical protein
MKKNIMNKQRITSFTKKQLAELNLTANLFILFRLDKIEDELKTLALKLGYDLNKPSENKIRNVRHLPELLKKVLELKGTHFF